MKCENGAGDIYISTLTEFANSEKGFSTLAAILNHAGVAVEKKEINPNDVFFVRDGQLQFPASAINNLVEKDGKCEFSFYVFSPRPLDDLLIEPDMPKLSLEVKGSDVALSLDGKPIEAASANRHEARYKELPLLQGWNKLTVTIPAANKHDFNGFFSCANKADFISMLKASYINPESK